MPVVLVLALLIPAAAQQQRPGTITGTVLNESGRPIKGATVYAECLEGQSGMMPQALSGKEGHYAIKGLPLGHFYVYAAKENEGYPRLKDALYAGAETPLPEVSLTAENPSTTLVVKLGKKAGWLTGSVRDESTGELLATCSELRRKGSPKAGGEFIRENFRVMIPSDTPVTLKVWEWGYQPWFFRGADGGDVLAVGPGEELHLEVRLKGYKPPRQPTEAELRDMKKSLEETGCSTAAPPDTSD